MAVVVGLLANMAIIGSMVYYGFSGSITTVAVTVITGTMVYDCYYGYIGSITSSCVYHRYFGIS